MCVFPLCCHSLLSCQCNIPMWNLSASMQSWAKMSIQPVSQWASSVCVFDFIDNFNNKHFIVDWIYEHCCLRRITMFRATAEKSGSIELIPTNWCIILIPFSFFWHGWRKSISRSKIGRGAGQKYQLHIFEPKFLRKNSTFFPSWNRVN